jgi:hypothetical protein
MFKGVVISAVVLVGLSALADRGLAAAAGDATATSIARMNNLGDEPDVSFRGFPFLTQAFRGRFTEVDVEARDVRVEGMTFSRIEAELRGVEVGLRDALAGEVEAIPVESGEAVVSIDYSDINAYLDAKPGSPRVSGSVDGVLTVRSTIGVTGRGSVAVEGRGSATVTADGVLVRVTGVHSVEGAAIPASLVPAATGRLNFTIPTRRLPFGLVLRSVSVEESALRVSAVANGVVVRVR